MKKIVTILAVLSMGTLAGCESLFNFTKKDSIISTSNQTDNNIKYKRDADGNLPVVYDEVTDLSIPFLYEANVSKKDKTPLNVLGENYWMKYAYAKDEFSKKSELKRFTSYYNNEIEKAKEIKTITIEFTTKLGKYDFDKQIFLTGLNDGNTVAYRLNAGTFQMNDDPSNRRTGGKADLAYYEAEIFNIKKVSSISVSESKAEEFSKVLGNDRRALHKLKTKIIGASGYKLKLKAYHIETKLTDGTLLYSGDL